MERINEKGTIKINKHIFGRLVWDAVELTEGKVFSASEKGKQLTGIGGSRPAPGEIADHMTVQEREGAIYVEFYVILSFGASIRKNSELILNYMEESLRLMFPNQKGRILMKVVGVKSKHTASRNIEVERTWN